MTALPIHAVLPDLLAALRAGSNAVLVKLNREQEMTILVVEQKLGFARRVAHDYCIMEKGAIVASGAMSSLDEEQVKQYLMV